MRQKGRNVEFNPQLRTINVRLCKRTNKATMTYRCDPNNPDDRYDRDTDQDD